MIPKYGGGGENRTLKKTLQGFQFPVSLRPLNWCRPRKSNPQPIAYKAIALPIELGRRYNNSI